MTKSREGQALFGTRIRPASTALHIPRARLNADQHTTRHDTTLSFWRWRSLFSSLNRDILDTGKSRFLCFRLNQYNRSLGASISSPSFVTFLSCFIPKQICDIYVDREFTVSWYRKPWLLHSKYNYRYDTAHDLPKKTSRK